MSGTAFRQYACCLGQSQCAAWIPESSPHPQDILGFGAGQVRRSGPAFHPVLPWRRHPGGRSLLAHDLAHQHTPWVHTGNTPRQCPGVLGVPGDDAAANEIPEDCVGGHRNSSGTVLSPDSPHPRSGAARGILRILSSPRHATGNPLRRRRCDTSGSAPRKTRHACMGSMLPPRANSS